MRRRWLQVVGLAAAAWITFELIWVATGRPAPQIDYAGQLAELTASHQAGGDNAWESLAETARIVQETLDELRDRRRAAGGHEGWRPDFSRILDGPADPALWDIEREAIETLRRRGVMDRLARIAEAPRFSRPMSDASQLYESGWTQLSHIRELSRIRAASMRLAFLEHDTDEVAASLDQALGVVRGLGSQPLMLDRMLAVWGASIPLAQLEHGLLEHEIDLATCHEILAVLDRQARLAPDELVFEAQRLGILEMVQQHFTDDGHGDGRLDMGGTGMPMLGTVGMVGRRETTRLVNELADGMVAIARQSPVARLTTPAFDLEAFADQLDFRHDFIRASMQQLPMVLDSGANFAARVEAIRIMVALAAWRTAHGEYPETLDLLAPVFLPAIPLDPTHGGAFVYRRQPAHPDLPYLLYSTGVDVTDDSIAVHPELVETGRTFSESVTIEGRDRLFDPRRPTDGEP